MKVFKMVNLYNNNSNITVNQEIYDNFNGFMISSDRNVFNKMCTRIRLFEMVKELNGDIVECGVFKGSGLLTWLKLIDLYQPNSIKKVIGFDFFGNEFVDGIIDDVDRNTMKQVFTRDSSLETSDISIESITNKIKTSGFKDSKYDLVKGDISFTSSNYLKDRPGFRISLLYLDLDLDKPTYDALENLWDRIVDGGCVVFDEYAYHSWSESNAVDRFLKDKNIRLLNTHVHAPTAYFIKEK
jgi:hypothetical protein